jgi:hypothetical protein
MFGGKTIFVLDLRAEYSEAERANINKYKLGGEDIYSSAEARAHLEAGQAKLDGSARGLAGGLVSLAMARMKLSISIKSLQDGVHIECKDLQELLEAETAVRNACTKLVEYLKVAAQFDGSTEVVEFGHAAAA